MENAMQFRKAVEGKVAHQKKAATIAFFILLVCWTPALIAGFPGYFTYDSGLGWLEQWGQYSTGNLNAHHPVLHTLFVGSLISVGQALFDSFNAGVLLAVFVQALLVSFLLSFSLYQLLNLGMGKKGLVASTVYLALNPIIQLFAFCTTKDVLFSAFVVVYVVLLFRLVHEKDKSNTARVILLSVLLFLICVLRSNAIVAFLLALPIQLLLLKGFGKSLAVSAVAALLACGLFLGPISSAIGVKSSPIGLWNALCIPEQQLARTAFSPSVDSADKDEIFSMFPGLEYKDNLSDIARNTMMNSGTSKGEMMKEWIRLGVKYPKQYLAAFIFHTKAVWNPIDPIRVYSNDLSQSNVFGFVAQKPCEQIIINESLTDIYRFVSKDARASSVPILGLLVGISLYVILLIVAVAAGARNKSRACMVTFLPLLLLVCLTYLDQQCY